MLSAKERALLKKISDFSHSLAKKYRLRRVYLFGSLAQGLFLRSSDIDLAVEGMNFRDYLKALSEHRQIKGRHLDLLHLGLCRPHIKESIVKKGKILYERH